MLIRFPQNGEISNLEIMKTGGGGAFVFFPRKIKTKLLIKFQLIFVLFLHKFFFLHKSTL